MRPIKILRLNYRHFQCLFLTALALCSAATADEMRTRTAVLETATERHTFNTEIAITPEQKRRGLSKRKHLDEDAGMLFLFDPPQPAAMWMADTFISLDMLFIRANGEIASIASHTKPLSRRLIPSPVPVRWVLEIPAGRAAALGIRPGDRLCLPDCAGCARMNPCK